jgi:cell division transport system ATP-binding protein
LISRLLANFRPQPSSPPGPFIHLGAIHKTYPNGAVGLQGIDLALTQGEFLWISGVSGSGKSTLLKLLFGAEQPTTGEVWVDQQQVTQLKAPQLARLRRRLGVVFQDYKLLPRRTVGENITFVLKALGYDRPEIRRRLWPTLKRVGLEAKVDCFPEQLSGGEQQRVALARAIVHSPMILLADEPTGNLDPENTGIVMETIQALHQAGTTVIITTHDQALLSQTPHRIITLDRGLLV